MTEAGTGGPLLVPVIVNDALALCCKEPLVPVTVMGNVPGDAPAVVAMVNVFELEPGSEVKVKLPVTPEGNPETPKVTVPLNPLMAVTVTVYCALLLAVMLPGPADIEMEKSGVGTLVTVQVPLSAHPLSCARFWTSIYTFFVPTNAGLKLTARITVKVVLVPAPKIALFPASTTH